MPLESLRQPFNPDEPGRKLREVQAPFEEEGELLETAREQYEWLTNPETGLMRPGIGSVNLDTWHASIMQDPRNPGEDLRIVAEYESMQMPSSKAQSKVVEKLKAKGVGSAVDEMFTRAYLVMRYDAASAKEMLEAIQGRFSQDDNGLWCETFDPTDVAKIRYSHMQLGMLAIDQILHPEEAQQKFSSLQQNSKIYNKEKKVWYAMIDTQDRLPSSDVRCADQLTSVLVQLEFDPVAARKQYEYLRQSSLFSKEYNVWVAWVDADLQRYKELALATAQDQFLDVLIRKAFEKKGVLDIFPNTTSQQIPEERNF